MTVLDLKSFPYGQTFTNSLKGLANVQRSISLLPTNKLFPKTRIQQMHCAAEIGSNQIVGTDPEKIFAAYRNATNGKCREPQIPPLWDGKAAEHIVGILFEEL